MAKINSGLHMKRGKGFLTYDSPSAKRKADRMERLRLPEPDSSVKLWRNAAKTGKRKSGGKRVTVKL